MTGATTPAEEAAVKLVEAAEERGVVLRLSAGMAVKVHCLANQELIAKLGRSIHDIDVVGYSKQRSAIEKVMAELGYTKRPTSMTQAFSFREIFIDPKAQYVVDVFHDRLQMNHTIDLRGRLELSSPTIPLADLLLQKLQIVELTEKDVRDIILLLGEHEVGEEGAETIGLDRLKSLLSADWGFYYTATTNLRKVVGLLEGYPDLPAGVGDRVRERADTILKAVEAAPKSLKWRLRAKIGPSLKWYRVVERFEEE
jgi:hypothetical protein